MPGPKSLTELFSDAGAIVTGSHLVYTPKEGGWFHGSGYVNKDMISKYPFLLSTCAREMVNRTVGVFYDVVAAPAVGAIFWGGLLALTRSEFLKDKEVLALYAEKEYPNPEDKSQFIFTFRKPYLPDIRGKRVLIAEDVANSGMSAKKMIEAVEKAGGIVQGVAAICNRSGQKVHDFLAPHRLFPLVEVNMQMWHESECPFCQRGVPINMSLGKARDWMATSDLGKAWKAKYEL
jgi:orotate phosphoribosyltransferase